jgi:predicted ester cyclase
VTTNTDVSITNDVPEAIAAQWVSAFNGGDLEAVLQFCSTDLIVHAIAPIEGAPPGLDRVALSLNMYRTAFPDGRFQIESLEWNKDRLVCRWTAAGLNTASFLGLSVIPKRITIKGTCQFRFVEGRVVEHWFDFNLYDVYEQFGALLPDPGHGFPESMAICQQAMETWLDALCGRAPRVDETMFAEDAVVQTAFFRRRLTERGRGACDRTVAFIRTGLSDIQVSPIDRVSQGATSTYRTRLTARPPQRQEPAMLKMHCMFETRAGRVSGFWIRIGRIRDEVV